MAFVLLFLLSGLPGPARQTVLDLHGSASDALVAERWQGSGAHLRTHGLPDCESLRANASTDVQKIRQGSLFPPCFPDKNESQYKIRRYLREYGYEFPTIRDMDHALVKKTLAKVTPEAAVFNLQGELVYHGRIDNLYERIGQSRRSATTHELADAIEAAGKGVPPLVPAADGVGCFISDLE